MAQSGVYGAFDIYPSAKGSGTHIEQCLKAMQASGIFPRLMTLGKPGSADFIHLDPLGEHDRFTQGIEHFLKRAIAYGRWLEDKIATWSDKPAVVQYRDPWSGVPFHRAFSNRSSFIYEVNSFPSIELKHRFEGIAPKTLEKIWCAEQTCLELADEIIVVSELLKNLVVERGIEKERIHLIPNGFEESLASYIPFSHHKPYIIYFGALQPWQGVDQLLEGFRYLEDVNVDLLIVSSWPEKRCKQYFKQIEKMGLSSRVHWHFQLSRPEVQSIVAGAELSIAPLTRCERHTVQGASPLKIIESLGVGTPVVSTDLSVVREIMTDGVHGRLIQPDRPQILARSIRVALDYPEQIAEWGQAGRNLVEQKFSWKLARSRLQQVYEKLRHYGTSIEGSQNFMGKVSPDLGPPSSMEK